MNYFFKNSVWSYQRNGSGLEEAHGAGARQKHGPNLIMFRMVKTHLPGLLAHC